MVRIVYKPMVVGLTLTAAAWAGPGCDTEAESSSSSASPAPQAAPAYPAVAASRPPPLWSIVDDPGNVAAEESGSRANSSGWMGRSAAASRGTAVKVAAKSKPTGTAIVVSKPGAPGGASPKPASPPPQPQPTPPPQPQQESSSPPPAPRQRPAQAKPVTAPPPAQPKPAARPATATGPTSGASRPPAAAPVRAVVPVPVAVPAPAAVAPEAGEDTPKEAVRVFFEAYAAGDAAGLRSVLQANDPVEHQFLDAMIRTAEAQAKVRKAAAGKYSADAAQAFVLLSPLPDDVLEQAQERLKGETATVSLADFPQPIVLRRGAGRWRLSVWGMMQGSTGPAAERTIKDMLAMAAKVDKVGDDIAAGRFKVVADAKAAWMKSMGMPVEKQQKAAR